MKIVIIQYNAGNVTSVMFALERLGVNAVLSDNHEEIYSADKVIFPGVGEAGSTMQYLKNKGLDTVIKNLKQPVLGICLGMQLLCSYSEEGKTDCLGIFEQKVLNFNNYKNTENQTLKVPHVGWNTITNLKTPLMAGLSTEEYVYFVHSFFVEKGVNSIAETDYLLPFSAALHKNNFYAAQFHPEKSGKVGEKIIKNFLEM
jgi:glutamine amidotransferase